MFSGVSPGIGVRSGGVGGAPTVNDSEPSMPGTAIEDRTPALRTAASVAMCAAVAALMGEAPEEALVVLLLPLPDTGPDGPDEPLLPLGPACPDCDPACEGAGPGFPPPPVLVKEGPDE